MSAREERLAELGLHLPPVPAPLAAYVAAVRTGNLVFVSGQLPLVDGKLALEGKVGAELSVEQARGMAQRAGLNAIAAAAEAAEGIERIERIVKLTGYVASAPGFTAQPEVLNGASELMGHVFGESAGAHARAAVGVAVLPLNSPVEIELVVEVS